MSKESWMKIRFKGDGEISATKYCKIKQFIEQVINNEA